MSVRLMNSPRADDSTMTFASDGQSVQNVSRGSRAPTQVIGRHPGTQRAISRGAPGPYVSGHRIRFGEGVARETLSLEKLRRGAVDRTSLVYPHKR